jgi:hypothetical protein
MKTAMLVATVTVVFVATSCTASEDHTSEQRSALLPSEPSISQPNDECSFFAKTTLPMYSGTLVDSTNGTVDLGNGQSATVFNYDGVSFNWSATIPISVMIIHGATEGPGHIEIYQPPKMSGGPLLDPPVAPAHHTTITFCYFFPKSTPPADAGAETGAGGNGPDSGGSNNDTDAGRRTDAGNGGANSGGGKTW